MSKTITDYIDQTLTKLLSREDGNYRIYFPLLIFDVAEKSGGKIKVLDCTREQLNKSMEVEVYNPENKKFEKRMSMGARTRIDYVTIEIKR